MFTTRHTKYCPSGSEVEITNREHGDVYIVEFNNVKFPCHKDFLTDDKPEEAVETITLRPPKSNDKDQLNLFGL